MIVNRLVSSGLSKTSVKKLDFNQRFGITVRNWRKQASISQEELAHRSGLHRTYISDVERGTRNVSLCIVEKLVTALGIPEALLFYQDCTQTTILQHSVGSILDMPKTVNLPLSIKPCLSTQI